MIRIRGVIPYRGGRTKDLSSLRFSSSHTTAEGEETIEGVWLFHRHGDRTPSKVLVAENFHDKEANFWRTKIPPLDVDRTYYRMLCSKYPTDIHESNNQGKFIDGRREPYGFLTWKGMEQMYNAGQQIARNYKSKSFTNEWEIKAYSTNYLRTVKSCQCFLDGLLSKDNDIPKETETTTHYENIDPDEYFPIQDDRGDEDERVFVKVRERKHDTLNAFDRFPDLMKSLVQDVVTTDSFIEKDTKAGCLAARLSNYLPGLMKASSYGGPSGINWIHASDHFVCRSSHNVPFSKFSHLENDINSEPTLAAMSYSTTSHLAWRFRTWYQSSPLLSAIAAPPLLEISKHMEDLLQSGNNGRKPFTIFSCHDVTILSLIYGVGADFVASSKDLQSIGMDPNNNQRWRYWPQYASVLVFELVRVQKEGKDDEFRIKILLNGEPIRTFTSLQTNENVIGFADFMQMIKQLNESNPCNKATDNGKEQSRDMSNWTG